HSEKIKESIKPIFILLICLISFPSDWSCVASLCILAFGTNRGNFKIQMLWMVFYVGIYSVVYFFALDRVYGIMQMAVILAIPILMMYNGQRGQNQIINKILKWTFYIYYPLHLFVLGCIQHM
ncbi:MAG: conjugal transfer protein TraX, partial [Firmicutes bacterium]|nr:conjugal transfer protein TraX [Bacillota bacterium]